MASTPSLSTLSVELQYVIFKKLDRPSTLSLALSCPLMLHLLANYYNLNRDRFEAHFIRKLGWLESVPCEDLKAQGAIIRWIAAPGLYEINYPVNVAENGVTNNEISGEERQCSTDGANYLSIISNDARNDMSVEQNAPPAEIYGLFGDDNYNLEEFAEVIKPYEETDQGKEELAVLEILEKWLKKKCGVEGEIVFCSVCYKFMRLRSKDGKQNRRAMWMIETRVWCRHCGVCEESYGFGFYRRH